MRGPASTHPSGNHQIRRALSVILPLAALALGGCARIAAKPFHLAMTAPLDCEAVRVQLGIPVLDPPQVFAACLNGAGRLVFPNGMQPPNNFIGAASGDLTAEVDAAQTIATMMGGF
ncbi:MAG TPA: hypothetical protein VEC38_10200 [Candidatus Binataceae bacterium]|nr:hypothetical protein [Candidatus Binataceae bacterium]